MLRLVRVSRLSATVVLATALTVGVVAQSRTSTPVPPVSPVPNDENSVRHALNRMAYGPKPGDVDRVRAIGLERYIDQQLNPERVADAAIETRLQSFSTLTMSSQELANKYFVPALMERQQRQRQAAAAGDTRPTDMQPPAGRAQGMTPDQLRTAVQPAIVTNELTQARMLRAVESERQLQEVLTDFWFNHFNVFIGKGQVRQYLTAYERDAIRPHVLGSFRELLGAVAKSPAMLFYLDNWQSSAEGATPVVSELERRLNDPNLTPQARQRLTTQLQRAKQAPRPTRGINENYARELLELHTLGVDGGYTQADVINLARIFTGWTIDQPRQGGGFIFRPATHDPGTKMVLGKTFAATGQSEGEFALDMLAAHPATAKHLARKLAQRFVVDEPTAALVDRVAKVFLYTRGDLRAVTRAVLTSPEFFAEDARRSKIKTPFEFVVSAVRATGATVTTAQPLVAALQTLGMPLYGAQQPTGYGTSASDWVNTGALIARMNLAVDLVNGGRIQPTRPANAQAAPMLTPEQIERRAARQQRAPAPVQIDVTTLAPDTSATSQKKVVDTLLGGTASTTTTQTLARAQTPQQLIALALGSPEFQRR